MTDFPKGCFYLARLLNGDDLIASEILYFEAPIEDEEVKGMALEYMENEPHWVVLDPSMHLEIHGPYGLEDGR